MSNRVWVGICQDGHVHRLYNEVVQSTPETLRAYLIHNTNNARVLEAEPLMLREHSPKVISHNHLIVAVMDNRCPDQAYPFKGAQVPTLLDTSGKPVTSANQNVLPSKPISNQPLGFTMESLLEELDKRMDLKIERVCQSAGITPKSTPTPTPITTPMPAVKSEAISSTKELSAKRQLSYTNPTSTSAFETPKPSDIKEEVIPVKENTKTAPIVPKSILKKTTPVVAEKPKPSRAEKVGPFEPTINLERVLPNLISPTSSTASPPIKARKKVTIEDLASAILQQQLAAGKIDPSTVPVLPKAEHEATTSEERSLKVTKWVPSGVLLGSQSSGTLTRSYQGRDNQVWEAGTDAHDFKALRCPPTIEVRVFETLSHLQKITKILEYDSREYENWPTLKMMPVTAEWIHKSPIKATIEWENKPTLYYDFFERTVPVVETSYVYERLDVKNRRIASLNSIIDPLLNVSIVSKKGLSDPDLAEFIFNNSYARRKRPIVIPYSVKRHYESTESVDLVLQLDAMLPAGQKIPDEMVVRFEVIDDDKLDMPILGYDFLRYYHLLVRRNIQKIYLLRPKHHQYDARTFMLKTAKWIRLKDLIIRNVTPTLQSINSISAWRWKRYEGAFNKHYIKPYSQITEVAKRFLFDASRGNKINFNGVSFRKFDQSKVKNAVLPINGDSEETPYPRFLLPEVELQLRSLVVAQYGDNLQSALDKINESSPSVGSAGSVSEEDPNSWETEEDEDTA